MKTLRIAFVIGLAAFLAAPAFAETTVVDSQGNRVVVDSQGNRTVIGQPAPSTTYVTTQEAALPSEYDFEGEIVQIDQPAATLVVRDMTPHDRRIKGDRGIVSTLKVGDYVKVDLRHGSETEAAHIVETRPSQTRVVETRTEPTTTVVQTR
ncbi:MAG TPA: hypothetical protein VL404_08785 [Candidatus Eisenbacteria bacterium]|nr:hypothetical protein [Candidatus Eisenbacteria bacterium]